MNSKILPFIMVVLVLLLPNKAVAESVFDSQVNRCVVINREPTIAYSGFWVDGETSVSSAITVENDLNDYESYAIALNINVANIRYSDLFQEKPNTINATYYLVTKKNQECGGIDAEGLADELFDGSRFLMNLKRSSNTNSNYDIVDLVFLNEEGIVDQAQGDFEVDWNFEKLDRTLEERDPKDLINPKEWRDSIIPANDVIDVSATIQNFSVIVIFAVIVGLTILGYIVARKS